MWTAVEVRLGIICVCVPWIKPLYKFHRDKTSVAEIKKMANTAPRTLRVLDRCKPRCSKVGPLSE
ncbi:hypothetical protein L209DRAFT_750760 [Thermothelomyces heterothallicus CBS 203.75]